MSRLILVILIALLLVGCAPDTGCQFLREVTGLPENVETIHLSADSPGVVCQLDILGYDGTKETFTSDGIQSAFDVRGLGTSTVSIQGPVSAMNLYVSVQDIRKHRVQQYLPTVHKD